jgi:acyl-CoA thioesterase I
MARVRDVSFVALAALSAMLGLAGNVDAEDAPPTIVTLGDSYITSYPAALQTALKSRGHLVEVIDTGFLNTSASGLEWLLQPAGQKLLAAPAGEAVILELGSNDCIGFDVDKTRANLDQIVSQLTKKHIPVLIVGTEPYTMCARQWRADYPVAYRQIFPDLAKQYGVIVYPDFKAGVTRHPELLQGDNDHPNAAGDAIIVRNMLPMFEALLAQVQPR